MKIIKYTVEYINLVFIWFIVFGNDILLKMKSQE